MVFSDKPIIAIKTQGDIGTVSVKSLAGKSFTVSKAPMAAGQVTPQWLAFKPATGLAAKGAVTTTAAVKGKAGVAAAKAKTGTAIISKPAVAAQTAKAASAGTIWNGSGLSLGLGLGLGAWGPILILGAAVAGISTYSYLKNSEEDEGSE